MIAIRDRYLQRLGLVRWQLREPANAGIEQTPAGETVQEIVAEPEVLAEPATETPASFTDRASLEAAIASCTRCTLHASRNNAVAGIGPDDAEWMVIGEAPGSEEDQRGEPFVGPAGQLLDRMLVAAGQSRDKVFITNILKCHPPGNREPHVGEVASCSDFLVQQIRWVAPKLILCVGRVAAQALLGSKESTAKLRGTVHVHPATKTPVIVTYHPAYLLREPAEKRKAWEDLKLAMRVTAGETA